MRASRNFLVLLAVCAALTLAACGDDDGKDTASKDGDGESRAVVPPELFGLWEIEGRDERGYGHLVAFYEDGRIRREVSLCIDFEYEFDGESLTVVDKSLDLDKEFTIPTTLRGDTIIQVNAEAAPGTPGSELRKERIALIDGTTDPIAGVYRYKSPAGLGFELFDGNGKMHLRMPHETPHNRGTFSVEGDVVTLQFEGIPPEPYTYAIEGDVLTLTAESGIDERFVKNPHGPWFLVDD